MAKYKTKSVRLIRLFYLLCNEEIVSGQEIVKALGVEPRTVYRYINELREAGIEIEGISGYNGGFRIVSVPLRLRRKLPNKKTKKEPQI